MSEINWDLAPEGADSLKQAISNNGNLQWFKGLDLYLGDGKYANTISSRWKTIATRPQTKTVADAYEHYNGVWPNKDSYLKCRNGQFFTSCSSYLGSDGECYIVCAREQFEAYAKEQETKQEGEKWTHETNSGYKCKKLISKPDVNGMVIVLTSDGEYMRHSEHALKPIKPKLTTKEYELMIGMASHFDIEPEKFNEYMTRFDTKFK